MEAPAERSGQSDPLRRDPTSVPAFMVGRAGRAMTALFAERLAGVGLKPHSFVILLHLSRDPVLTSAELARRAEMTPQSMSTLLRTLQEHGWVDRAGGVRRGQRIDVRITTAGQAALERARPVLGDLSDPATMGLSHAEAQTLHALLQRVVTALGADVQPVP